MRIPTLLAAALLTAVFLTPAHVASAAPLAGICNKYCDGRDPSLSPDDRSPASVTLSGRSISLHLDDSDAMGWVSIQNGKAADEAWLDRTFDGGTTWTARVGGTVIPSGVSGWRGLMYNVDDWGAHGVGALRACGRASTASTIACTTWARPRWNSANRLDAAVTALMMEYDYSSGLFTPAGWWNNANALTAVAEHSRLTSLTSYRYALARTYDLQRTAYLGSFRNDYIDDTGWWGLAWIAAYDLTGDARYLTTARTDADYMHTYWDSSCGGGVWWRTSKTSKTAIANSLYVELNAALGRRISGDTTYRGRAAAGWKWIQATGLINGEGLVNDSVSNSTCKNAGTTMWTYNSGKLVQALVELNKLNGDAAAMTAARKVATALTTSTRFNQNGIFREQCEPGCDGSLTGSSFKGAAVRGIGSLNRATGGTYSTWLKKQADTAYARDRNLLDQYGYHWAGPYDGSHDTAGQHSALDLLNAAT